MVFDNVDTDELSSTIEQPRIEDSPQKLLLDAFDQSNYNIELPGQGSDEAANDSVAKVENSDEEYFGAASGWVLPPHASKIFDTEGVYIVISRTF